MSVPPEVASIKRPDPSLMAYYLISSFAAGPGFPVLMLLGYFRYRTLQYRFDDEGVSMSWGVLHRREVHLTFSRIQDIHLTSNVVERWFGLARVQVQTASGSSKAEMTIEGVKEFVGVRDFLYGRMRGAKSPATRALQTPSAPGGEASDLAALLQQTAAELREIRLLLESGQATEAEQK